ncbi:MAG TPA: hypothetical protein VMT61_09360 [Candidatus Binataceae bacterium]|nr:hypothetical protein [Candidatus Binataceae bacterium]
MARRLITCGWIVGSILGVLTILGSLFNLGGLNIFNLIDAAIMLGLAYGTYRTSRICAVLALAYYAFNQMARLRMAHASSMHIGVIATVTVFCAAYIAGVVGTFGLRSNGGAAKAAS